MSPLFFVAPRLYDGEHAYILEAADRRVVFVLPYEGAFSLVGTTDGAVDMPAAPSMSDDEAAYLCDVVNAYFKAGVSPTDAVWSFAGIRPLYDDDGDDPSAVSRDYVLDLNAPAGEAPLLSVFGGKITVYRRLAEHALEDLRPFLPAMGEAWTASAPLPGGDLPNGDFATFVNGLSARYPWFDRIWLRSLARRHGTVSTDILDGAQKEADLGRHFGAGLYAREVDHLIAREWVMTAGDVLWRRTKTGLHLDQAGRDSVAEYVAGHPGVSESRHAERKEAAAPSTRLALPVHGVV